MAVRGRFDPTGDHHFKSIWKVNHSTGKLAYSLMHAAVPCIYANQKKMAGVRVLQIKFGLNEWIGFWSDIYLINSRVYVT